MRRLTHAHGEVNVKHYALVWMHYQWRLSLPNRSAHFKKASAKDEVINFKQITMVSGTLSLLRSKVASSPTWPLLWSIVHQIIPNTDLKVWCIVLAQVIICQEEETLPSANRSIAAKIVAEDDEMYTKCLQPPATQARCVPLPIEIGKCMG